MMLFWKGSRGQAAGGGVISVEHENIASHGTFTNNLIAVKIQIMIIARLRPLHDLL